MAEDFAAEMIRRVGKCYCGEEPVAYTCKKNGPNYGRKYYGCPKRQCRFFKSADGKQWIVDMDAPPRDTTRAQKRMREEPEGYRHRRETGSDTEEEEPLHQRRRPLAEGFVSAAKLLKRQQRDDFVAVDTALKRATSLVSKLEAALELAAQLCPGSCMDPDVSDGEYSPAETGPKRFREPRKVIAEQQQQQQRQEPDQQK